MKITNAYAVGGPQCTVRAVQALTGIAVNRLIVIDFEGFKAIIDGLQGVTMSFAGPVVDGQTVIVPAAGTQTVFGDQALALVRARHIVGDPTGDPGRIGRQQQVIAALLAQTLSTEMLLQPDKLTAALQAFIANTMTDNVTLDDLVLLTLSVKGTGSKVVGLHSHHMLGMKETFLLLFHISSPGQCCTCTPTSYRSARGGEYSPPAA